MDPEDLTTAGPAAIDTAWSPLEQQLDRAEYAARTWDVQRTGVRLPESLRDEIAHLREAVAPFRAEFERRGGWQRYFLAGLTPKLHVGAGRCVSSPWVGASVPELSGLSTSEAEAHGYRTCAQCWPASSVTPEPDENSDRDVATSEPLSDDDIVASFMVMPDEGVHFTIALDDGVAIMRLTGRTRVALWCGHEHNYDVEATLRGHSNMGPLDMNDVDAAIRGDRSAGKRLGWRLVHKLLFDEILPCERQ